MRSAIDHRILPGNIFQHRQELIPTLTGEQVVGAHDASRNTGEKPQDIVAGGMAMPVVQLLEMVDIDDQQRYRLEAESRQMLGKAAAIEGAGQRIVVSEFRQLISAALGGHQHHRHAAQHDERDRRYRHPAVNCTAAERIRPANLTGRRENAANRKNRGSAGVEADKQALPNTASRTGQC